MIKTRNDGKLRPHPGLEDKNKFNNQRKKIMEMNKETPKNSLFEKKLHSKITYPRYYGIRERSLPLTGKACFDVAKDPGKRFTVKVEEKKNNKIFEQL
jgi:hypothetical protein